MYNSLQPFGLQHTSCLCPPPSLRVCSDSCPLSWWCYLTISSSADPFCLCLHSFTASGSFPVNWFSTSGGQSIGYLASATNEYSGLISLRIDYFDLQGTLKSLLQHHNSQASILRRSAFFMVELSTRHMTTRKPITLMIQTFFSKVFSAF